MSRDTMADGVTPCTDPALLAARHAWASGATFAQTTPVAALDAEADRMIAATRALMPRGLHVVRDEAPEQTASGVSLEWLAATERRAERDRAAMLGRLR